MGCTRKRRSRRKRRTKRRQARGGGFDYGGLSGLSANQQQAGAPRYMGPEVGGCSAVTEDEIYNAGEKACNEFASLHSNGRYYRCRNRDGRRSCGERSQYKRTRGEDVTDLVMNAREERLRQKGITVGGRRRRRTQLRRKRRTRRGGRYGRPSPLGRHGAANITRHRYRHGQGTLQAALLRDDTAPASTARKVSDAEVWAKYLAETGLAKEDRKGVEKQLAVDMKALDSSDKCRLCGIPEITTDELRASCAGCGLALGR